MSFDEAQDELVGKRALQFLQKFPGRPSGSCVGTNKNLLYNQGVRESTLATNQKAGCSNHFGRTIESRLYAPNCCRPTRIAQRTDSDAPAPEHDPQLNWSRSRHLQPNRHDLHHIYKDFFRARIG